MGNLINGLGGAAGFGTNTLTRNDDSSTSNISLTSVFGAGGLNFFGTKYTAISINNNGNITFGSGGLGTYTPFSLQSGGVPIIAPFFADVDTRGGASATLGPNVVTPTAGGTSQGSNLVYYDLNAVTQTLTVTWDDVGYYSYGVDKLNAFQLQLVGTGSGNFDVFFHYEAINWTTGSASGGTSGLGGTPARAGYSTGNGVSWTELTQSGIQDQMLALPTTIGNTGVAGEYKFSVLSGTAANNTMIGTAGADVLAAGAGNDTIFAGAGNDTLDGGTGADRMVGGLGDDIYIIDNVRDILVESLGQGIDTAQTRISYALGSNIENLRLTGYANLVGTGNALNNTLAGNNGNNTLTGGAGNDTLDGGLGNNKLNGGTGSDTVLLDGTLADYTISVIKGVSTTQAFFTLTGLQPGDIVQLTHNGRVDKMTGIENVKFIGDGSTVAVNGTTPQALLYNVATYNNDTLTGSNGADTFDGGAGNDTINGGAGNDILSGATGIDTLDGGAGDDTLTGGLGNDTYVLDSANDIVNESTGVGSGIDTVNLAATYAAATYILAANVEKLDASALPTAITLTGNVLANTITGGTGNDTIDGGLGADTLSGGLGNDILSGGAGADKLTGGDGNDTLDGGAGSDTMAGGLGDDIYVVDSAANLALGIVGDTITELAGAGIDTVQSSISYALGLNLENLTLTGTTNLSGTGNGLGNTLTGNSGNNILNGGTGNDTLDGVSGADTLLGGLGDDTLIYDSADKINGGAGINDILKISVAGIVLDLSMLTAGKITGIEKLDLTGSGNNSLLVNKTSLLNLTGPAGHDLYVTGDTGDSVSITGSMWTDAGIASGYHQYINTAGTDHLYVQDTLALV